MILCQKYVLGTWTLVSSHTFIVDAVASLDRNNNGLAGSMTPFRVTDDQGSPIYMSQAALASPVQNVTPFPNQFLRDVRLFKVYP